MTSLDQIDLYSAIADGYDHSFTRKSHRRVYDQLTFAHVGGLGLPADATVIDVGCGGGRWSQALVQRGASVIGIEQAPGMIVELEKRQLGPRFRLVEGAMEQVELPPDDADLVLALGSMQYAADPARMLRRFAGWVKPGGLVCVVVDSLAALVLELLRAGREAEAMERLVTRRGLFRQGDHTATLHLYDRQSLEADFRAAGLSEVRCHGLAVGASALGRDGLSAAMETNETLTMQRELVLSNDPALVDCGLHLLAIGRRPSEIVVTA